MSISLYERIDWSDGETRIRVYTDDVSIVDEMGKPDAAYMKKGKTFAVHYIVIPESEQCKKIFGLLNLTKKQEVQQKKGEKIRRCVV